MILEGERKSIQPISQCVASGNVQALHQFVSNSPWEAQALSLAQARWLLKQAGQKQPGLLILDDTSLPKKGEHSVGVARQNCGALGKAANCQSIVSWHWTSAKVQPALGGTVVFTQELERGLKAPM